MHSENLDKVTCNNDNNSLTGPKLSIKNWYLFKAALIEQEDHKHFLFLHAVSSSETSITLGNLDHKVIWLLPVLSGVKKNGEN